jgi:hypothetical protein
MMKLLLTKSKPMPHLWMLALLRVTLEFAASIPLLKPRIITLLNKTFLAFLILIAAAISTTSFTVLSLTLVTLCYCLIKEEVERKLNSWSGK